MIPNEVRDIVKKTESRLPLATYGKRSFETWEWTGKPRDGKLVPEEAIKIWQAIGRWQNGSFPSLFIYGTKGIGKTHIALAIGWQKLIGELGSRVLFYQVEGLMDQIREGSWSLVVGAKTCDLLILDDIGAQKSTEWSLAKLDSIIDYRYIEGMETIFTSNYSLSNTDKIPERIADRIREGTVVRLRGESRRGK
jgi:DNA replication protein DnaC